MAHLLFGTDVTTGGSEEFLLRCAGRSGSKGGEEVLTEDGRLARDQEAAAQASSRGVELDGLLGQAEGEGKVRKAQEFRQRGSPESILDMS